MHAQFDCDDTHLNDDGDVQQSETTMMNTDLCVKRPSILTVSSISSYPTYCSDIDDSDESSFDDCDSCDSFPSFYDDEDGEECPVDYRDEASLSSFEDDDDESGVEISFTRQLSTALSSISGHSTFCSEIEDDCESFYDDFSCASYPSFYGQDEDDNSKHSYYFTDYSEDHNKEAIEVLTWPLSLEEFMRDCKKDNSRAVRCCSSNWPTEGRIVT